MPNSIENEPSPFLSISAPNILNSPPLGGFSQAQLSLAEAQRLINEEARGASFSSSPFWLSIYDIFQRTQTEKRAKDESGTS